MKLDFMQTTAVANRVILQIYLHRIYNLSFKIKCKIYIASGSAKHPPPQLRIVGAHLKYPATPVSYAKSPRHGPKRPSRAGLQYYPSQVQNPISPDGKQYFRT